MNDEMQNDLDRIAIALKIAKQYKQEDKTSQKTNPSRGELFGKDIYKLFSDRFKEDQDGVWNDSGIAQVDRVCLI